MNIKPLSIAVVMGGTSAEREVSLVTGNAVADALAGLGHAVSKVDPVHGVKALLAALDPAPDVVFNALHGTWGEDGRVQGLLDLLGIPYTHSGVTASAVAMDKPLAKRLFRQAGLPVGPTVLVNRDGLCTGDPLPRPYVVKPCADGSSVGVRIITKADPDPAFTAEAWPYGTTRLMAEPFVPGRELTVAVLGHDPLGVLEIRPREGFYDYTAKYTDGKAEHLLPAPVPDHIAEQAMRVALMAHRTLGCQGVSRSDFRYDNTDGEPGRLVLLEVNTQPGMTPLSLVPEIAAHAGIPFPVLCQRLVEDALCRA